MFAIVAKEAIFFYQEEISGSLFNSLNFCARNVYAYIVKNGKDISHQSFLIFRDDLHLCITFGVFAIYLDLRRFDMDLFESGLFVGDECVVKYLFYVKHLFFRDLFVKFDMKIFDIVEEFEEIHRDNTESAEFGEDITEIDTFFADDTDGEKVMIGNAIGKLTFEHGCPGCDIDNLRRSVFDEKEIGFDPEHFFLQHSGECGEGGKLFELRLFFVASGGFCENGFV